MQFIRHYFILILLCLTISCGSNSTSSGDSIMNDPDSTTAVTLSENIHSSLPTAWVTEYGTIKNNLLTLLPLYQKYYKSIVIYAWNDNVEDPYSGVEGGAYISSENGDDTIKRFVTEIPNQEFIDNSYHRYSVIAHEYFHCYQLTLNRYMNYPNDDPSSFDTKWLIEGTAAIFEGMYIQQYYGDNYTQNSQNEVHANVLSNPSSYESSDSNGATDINYSSSIFLVLVLAKELQNLGYTEVASFKMILKDYMATQPNKSTWEANFLTTFKMTVSDFYSKTSAYTPSNTPILPTSSMTLQSIFN